MPSSKASAKSSIPEGSTLRKTERLAVIATAARTSATPLHAESIEGANLSRLGPQERINFIRLGIPVSTIGNLSSRMGLSKESLLSSLGLSRATIGRKERDATPLSKDESERVLGVESLIGLVEVMIEQSGDPSEFDAARWLADWLFKPLPALAGATPASYLDTFEGQRLVSELLSMSQSGAYA